MTASAMSPGGSVGTAARIRSRLLGVSALTFAIQRWCIIGVIASYMVSIYLYKMWYVATAAALVVTTVLVVLGGLRYRGVFTAVLPLVVYFGWLLATALWATYPRLTVWFASVDAIEIAIAALFYLLALNQPSRVNGVVMAFVWLAIPATLLTLLYSPAATRSGGYSIWILPFAPAFCWAEIASGGRKVRAALALAAVFGLLIIDRSRTPILVAIFVTSLAVFAHSRGVLLLLRRTLVAVVVCVLAFGALVYFRPSRTFALITLSRFTHLDMHVGDVYIEAERKVDPVRVQLHKAALFYGRQHFWVGMGYRNFPDFFALHWSPNGQPTTLHSIYETWWVGGGVVCLLIVAAIFVGHFRSLMGAMRRTSDATVRRLTRTVLVASLGIFVFGLFHQTHMNPMMYALLGMGAALPQVAPVRRRGRGGGLVARLDPVFGTSGRLLAGQAGTDGVSGGVAKDHVVR